MTTPKNVLPEWAAAQATPWAPHNQALFDVDQLMQISVLDVALTQEPGGETEGDAYIVAAPATGAWSGQEDRLAYFINGAYVFKNLVPGALIFNQADSKYYNWNGTDVGELNIARSVLRIARRLKFRGGRTGPSALPSRMKTTRRSNIWAPASRRKFWPTAITA